MSQTEKTTTKPKAVKKKKVTLLENVKLGNELYTKGTVLEVPDEKYEILLNAKVIAVDESQ